MGGGGSNNNQGGGGGGCGAGYKDSQYPTATSGCGMGGRGGGESQAGLSGGSGFCGIFYGYVAGIDSGCDPKTV